MVAKSGFGVRTAAAIARRAMSTFSCNIDQVSPRPLAASRIGSLLLFDHLNTLAARSSTTNLTDPIGGEGYPALRQKRCRFARGP
jgi:hypothetical protein